LIDTPASGSINWLCILSEGKVLVRAKAAISLLLCIALLQATAFAEVAPALGQVTQADHARLGNGALMSGATLFEGDRLTTEMTGSLRANLNSGQLFLLADSTASVRRAGKNVEASLERGAAIFSSTGPEGLQLAAITAIVRARLAQSTIGEVTLLGANQFVVTCQRGELEVLVGDEVRTVEAGRSYQVVMDDSPGPQGAGTHKTTAGGRRKALWIPLAIIGGGVAYGMYRALRKVSDD
jgi:hypothetical protein